MIPLPSLPETVLPYFAKRCLNDKGHLAYFLQAIHLYKASVGEDEAPEIIAGIFGVSAQEVRRWDRYQHPGSDLRQLIAAWLQRTMLATPLEGPEVPVRSVWDRLLDEEGPTPVEPTLGARALYEGDYTR